MRRITVHDTSDVGTRRSARPSFSLILEAYAMLLIMDVAMRCVGVAPCWRWISKRCRRRAGRYRSQSPETNELVRAVRSAAAHHLYPMRCLTQSLALGWMLAERGVAAHLRFGVLRERSLFAAHAWLEVDGVPVNDSANPAERYATLRMRSGCGWV
jgi:hypothetical protein